MLFLLIMIFFHQVINRLEYRTQAKRTRERWTDIPAIRGHILTEYKSKPIAYNRNSFSINLVPSLIPQQKKSDLIMKLSDYLNLPILDIINKLSYYSKESLTEILIKKDVQFNTIQNIAEHIESFPGISWNDEPFRVYPEKELFSHIIGYIGNISQESLQILYADGYKPTSIIGKLGVEKFYDKRIRGVDGKQKRIVDAKNYTIDKQFDTRYLPEPGNDLYLTVDPDLQHNVQKIIGNSIGAAIVIKPSNGEILAMVSYPNYDPNVFIKDTVENQARRKKYALDKQFPFFNRNIQSSYPASSIFKLILATAILEKNILPVTQKLGCYGGTKIGNRFFKCHRYHTHVNLNEAIRDSCNTYFYQTGLQVGISTINEYAKYFGFGQISGIDLPGEIPGFVPSPIWKEATVGQKWFDGDTANTSIGQGFIKVTPLQIANLICIIVNDGLLFQPHLMKHIKKNNSNEIIETYKPKVVLKTDFKASTFQFLKDSMRQVVTDGTAAWAFATNPIMVAGKTGTAQAGEHSHSWFGGFGPVDAPVNEQVVVVAISEHANVDYKRWASRIVSMIFYAWKFDTDFEEAAKNLRFSSVSE